MFRSPVAPIPTDDPLGWRPQVARRTGRRAPIRDPILEPDWDGDHVLAHFYAGAEPQLRMIDVDGAELTAKDPQLTAAVEKAILANDAVIDGILTEQALRTGIGAAIVHQSNAGRSGFLIPRDPGIDVEAKTVERAEGLAFVAIDLLRLDGQSLLDLPLLERKRLLDGVIEQSHLVRVTPHTRPPIGPWLESWKSTGFRGVIVKAANSRYRPTSLADDWTVVWKIHRF